MSVKTKSVSRGYAKREFVTVGLVLIIYCLYVLFVPMLVKELLVLYNIQDYMGLNLNLLASLVCLIIGSVLPFILLRIKSQKKLRDFNNKSNAPFREHLVNFIVFFAVVSGLIFATMMVSQYINVPGRLISNIGVTFNGQYMTDSIYIVSFILIAPILEEYAFRGVLLNCLSRYGKYFAVVASSLIYALAHGSFVEMIPSFFMGLILSKKSLYYKSITPTIIIHVLFNAAIYGLIMIPEKYNIYMVGFLVLMIILAVVLLVSKEYRLVRIKKSESNKKVGLLFLSTSTVIIAVLLFLGHSVLLLLV